MIPEFPRLIFKRSKTYRMTKAAPFPLVIISILTILCVRPLPRPHRALFNLIRISSVSSTSYPQPTHDVLSPASAVAQPISSSSSAAAATLRKCYPFSQVSTLIRITTAHTSSAPAMSSASSRPRLSKIISPQEPQPSRVPLPHLLR